MRLFNYRSRPHTRSSHGQLGLQHGDQLLGLPETHQAALPGGLLALLRSGADALAHAKALFARHGVPMDPADIHYLPPIEQPPKILCVGLNYRDHTEESGFEQPENPTVFARFASSLTGHGQPIVRPACSEQLDYEGELALFIGRGGRHIPAAKALEHVAGYAICNEASVRDYQFKSPQWTLGKNFDATAAIGPCFVSAEELPAGARGLRIATRLNGRTVQSARTDQMIFDIPAIIAALSEAMTLEPGTVIVTGTPSGVGLGRQPPLWMRPGDRVEVEIEGLGVLSNPIVAEVVRNAARAPQPAITTSGEPLCS